MTDGGNDHESGSNSGSKYIRAENISFGATAVLAIAVFIGGHFYKTLNDNNAKLVEGMARVALTVDEVKKELADVSRRLSVMESANTASRISALEAVNQRLQVEVESIHREFAAEKEAIRREFKYMMGGGK